MSSCCASGTIVSTRERVSSKMCTIPALTVFKNVVVETNNNQVVIQIKAKLQLR